MFESAPETQHQSAARRAQGRPTISRVLSDAALRTLHVAGYEVYEPVAAGGFGVVYRARDRRLGRDVAIKVLDPGARSECNVDRGPGREIETLAALRHPHIVPLFAAGVLDDGLRYLVMPWVDGASLRVRLRAHGPLPVAEVLRLGIDLADALAALHAQGLVHRDVKPENVLLDGAHAMVIDFGLVCTQRSADDTVEAKESARIGTPDYMSPEQWTANGPIDGRADVFSLGCLLFELLTARNPLVPRARNPLVTRTRDRHRWTESLHSADVVDPTLRRMLHRVPRVREERADVPRSLDRLLRHAMAPSPARRLPSAQLFREKLQRVQAGLLNGDEGRRTRRTVLVAASAVIILVPWLVADRIEADRAVQSAAFEAQRILVTAARNATGDAALDPLVAAVSSRVHEALAQRLAGIRDLPGASERLVVETVPETLPVLTGSAGVAAARPLAMARGGGTVIALEVARVDTGLEVRGVLIDARGPDTAAPLPRAIVPVVASEAELGRVADSVAETIATALRNGRQPGGR